MSISTEGRNGTCWSAGLSSGETYMGKGEPFSGMVQIPEGKIFKVIVHLRDSASFPGFKFL